MMAYTHRRNFDLKRHWHRYRHYLLALTAALLVFLPGLAAPTVAQSTYPPFLDPHLNDYGQYLSPAEAANVRTELGTFQARTGIQVVVLTINSVQDYSTGDATLESFATNVFNTWGIGDAARDDGILLLVAPGDRAVRIELGSGYSARYDSVAQLIIDEYLLPRFRQGQINEGIAVGVTQIIRRFDPNQPEPDTRQPNPLANVSPDGGAGLLTGGAVGGLGISLVGGMVGYRRWLRYRQRNCPKCAIAMERLDEHTDDDYLSPGQRQEESLKSVDYDVWLCRSCGYHTIHDFANFISRHQKCPDCRHKTMTVDSRTVLEPTYTRTGTAEITEDCTFCQHHRVYDRTLPRKERTSSSSGSSSGGSGGGGRSSGGGASGSW